MAASIETLTVKARDAELENQHLASVIELKTAAADSLLQERLLLEQTNKDLLEKLAQYQGESPELKEKVIVLSQRCRKLKSDNKELRKTAGKLTETNQALSAQLQSKLADQFSTASQLKEVTSANKRLAAENSLLRIENERLKTEKITLTDTNVSFAQSSNRHESENFVLKEQNQRLSAEND
jgi:FtsZ-binding cell division protein ZapB